VTLVSGSPSGQKYRYWPISERGVYQLRSILSMVERSAKRPPSISDRANACCCPQSTIAVNRQFPLYSITLVSGVRNKLKSW
jgi:hypothetical protein